MMTVGYGHYQDVPIRVCDRRHPVVNATLLPLLGLSPRSPVPLLTPFPTGLLTFSKR